MALHQVLPYVCFFIRVSLHLTHAVGRNTSASGLHTSTSHICQMSSQPTSNDIKPTDVTAVCDSIKNISSGVQGH